MATKKQKRNSHKFSRIVRKIKRYYYYEKKVTPKLSITNKGAMRLFCEEFNIVNDRNIKNTIIELNNAKTNPVLKARAYRKPRRKNKDDWRADYDNYLQSPQWRNKRQELFNERGKKCEHCGATTQIHVHHIHYRNLGNEKLEDLMVLCKSCHEEEHKRLDSLKKPRKHKAKCNDNFISKPKKKRSKKVKKKQIAKPTKRKNKLGDAKERHSIVKQLIKMNVTKIGEKRLAYCDINTLNKCLKALRKR